MSYPAPEGYAEAFLTVRPEVGIEFALPFEAFYRCEDLSCPLYHVALRLPQAGNDLKEQVRDLVRAIDLAYVSGEKILLHIPLAVAESEE